MEIIPPLSSYVSNKFRKGVGFFRQKNVSAFINGAMIAASALALAYNVQINGGTIADRARTWWIYDKPDECRIVKFSGSYTEPPGISVAPRVMYVTCRTGEDTIYEGRELTFYRDTMTEQWNLESPFIPVDDY